ncbi:TRAP transporter substrate-binding protein [Thalassovita mangrovi]|uniref:ABC transporter substrate-binding protein n=1 Tax=Thalassovita mangrovi TaxID=2692236 RepID=A0A6L8LNL0_9RHOB|nr:TRAP transporter substrate-binding protein [Thalassovita mangrovi]MYM57578.1 ABC transporter substrate-binding protein [Thalassovita mangrovi]
MSLSLRMKSLVAGAALIASCGQALAENVTLRFSNWVPPTHTLTVDMFQPWAKDVEEATEGRVKIQFLPALGAPAAHFDLVRNGVADMAFAVHSYSPDRFPLTEFVELPFTAENAVVNSVAYWRTYEKFMAGANEHKGTHLLGLWVPGSYQLFTKTGPETLDDLDGLRIRIPGTLVEEISTKLGMVSISSPLTEAYDQISRGIIDGMFQDYSTVIDFNMTEHMPNFFTAPGGFSASSQFLVISDRAWNKISDADKAAIDALSGEAMVKRFAQIWADRNTASLAKLREAGLTQHMIEGESLAQLHAKLEPLAQEWVAKAGTKGVDAQAALDFYRAELDAVAEELGQSRN